MTRDAQSNYYINNTNVEKDVQDIFLGTGLGLKALTQLLSRAW